MSTRNAFPSHPEGQPSKNPIRSHPQRMVDSRAQRSHEIRSYLKSKPYGYAPKVKVPPRRMTVEPVIRDQSAGSEMIGSGF